MVKLVIKSAADDDVAEIVSYLVLNHAKAAAERLRNKFRSKYDDIMLFPDTGAKVKSKFFRRYLFVIVEKYYIFHTFKNNIVTIERVLHTARNYKEVLDKEQPV